jgi:FkbM family methyltransferase
MSLASLIDRLQLSLAKSRLAVTIAVKMRNQSNKIIAYSLARTHHSDKNGESLVLDKIVSREKYIFDVGANKGEWTELAIHSAEELQTEQKYYLFEPGRIAFDMLAKKFNGDQRVVLANIGLGDQDGELTFFEESNAGEQSSFVITKNHQHFTSHTLPIRTIDTYCEQNEIPQIDFLKVDCEGFDFKVLLGAKEFLKKGLIRYIQFEYGESWSIVGSTLSSAISYLESFGYTVYLITPSGLKKNRNDFYGEYFGYSNYLAVKIEALKDVSDSFTE